MTIKVTYNITDVYVTQDVSPVYINVSYSGGGGSGAAVWGGITGTLSNQTDLQNALNAKYNNPTGTTSQYLRGDGSLATFPSLTGFVPYTGATTNVNLGAFDLLVQGITIGKGNNSLVNNTALGHSTLLTATTGNFNTAVGYESLRNTTTGQYNTAVGQSSLFSNTTGGQNTALGLNALLSNTTGSSNVAVGLDTLQHITTGSSNTAIGYNAGSHITGGSTPNTTATNSVFIGRDSKANADGQTNQIVIGQNAVGNGSNTATFGNTATTANYFTGSINGGSFVKSGGTSSQFLKADGTVDSSVYVPTSRELTINGVTFDLSANRTFTVGSVTGSGASGQVTYWTGTSSQSGSNNLFWDATNSRLGIGTNTPSAILDMVGTGQIVLSKLKCSTNSGAASYTVLNDTNSSFEFGMWGSIRTSFGAILAGNGYVYGSADLAITTLSNIKFGAGTGVPERMRLFGSTGNLVLNSTTDSGERLQVTGTMKVTGNVAVDTNTFFVDTTNKRIGVRTATPGAGIDVWNYGTTEVSQFRVSDSRISIPSYSSTGFNPTLTASTCGFFAPTSSSTGGVQFAGFTTNSATASPFVFIGHHGSNAPTIAALRFLGFKHDGSTNRTALTGNEIIAGFSAGFNADVFQVKANGRINMSSLPTSSAGLATGDLWNDSGTIKIV